MQRRAFTNHWIAAAAVVLALVGCSKDDPVADKNALCAGESGVGLRVEGRSSPLDVCVPDADVDALLTNSNHYDISARSTLDNGTVVQWHMVFTRRNDAPVSLRLVNSVTEATSDPSTAYVQYTEIPTSGGTVESTLITGGSFRVTFNDDSAAVGTMENIAMDMTNLQSGDPAGERRITEGFFSVSVAPPALRADAAAPRARALHTHATGR